MLDYISNVIHVLQEQHFEYVVQKVQCDKNLGFFAADCYQQLPKNNSTTIS